MTDGILRVQYVATVYATKVPLRYRVRLAVDGIDSGIEQIAWLPGRARSLMKYMVEHGNDILNAAGIAERVGSQVLGRRREIAMAKLQVGDKVRLRVDLGPYPKGRVCTVVEVEEPAFYLARGQRAYDETRFPIKVIPTHSNGDPVLGPKDGIPLAAGEFGPLDEDIDD